jgi:hypothetical protein
MALARDEPGHRSVPVAGFSLRSPQPPDASPHVRIIMHLPRCTCENEDSPIGDPTGLPSR